jgi:hypothetical protein
MLGNMGEPRVLAHHHVPALLAQFPQGPPR